MSLLDDCYVGYLNLDIRPDRRELMEQELDRVGIKAERTRGKLPEEFDLTNPKFNTQVNRTPGSIGCWHGMEEIAMRALELNKNAVILEDDLQFCDDINERVTIIEEFIKDNEWDIIWLGGTVHIAPHFWHTGDNPDLPGSDMGKDCEYIGNKYLYRSYGSFSTHAWILNKKSIKKVFGLLDEIEHMAMGIDWALIKLAPKLNNFVFLPGCIIQRDNMSNIGNGMTVFSGFSRLGAHWYAKNLSDFNHDTYNWAEVKMKL